MYTAPDLVSPQKLQTFNFLSILNVIAILIQLSIFIYLIPSGLDLVSMSIFHIVTLGSSILFHLYPGIRTNSKFRITANTISLLSVGACVVLTVVVINSDGGLDSLLWALFLITFVVPAAFVAVTLLLLLNYDTQEEMNTFVNQQKIQYVFVQPQALTQFV